LKGSVFVEAFERYLEDYGHRGVGESDVMSPRFSDQPDALLNVVRVQLRGPSLRPDDILAGQRDTRTTAMTTIRARCSWRMDRWIIFQWWYRRLCRFFALREANRHHLMYYSTAARNLLVRLGERLVDDELFTSREDVFFLTMEERQAIVSGASRDWAALVRTRRAERDRWLVLQVPDTIRDWEEASHAGGPPSAGSTDSVLRGIPISPGLVSGSVRFVRSMADWSNVTAGDIIVAPVIDPGMAPLFGIAGGLIVEMGGTLSHGAIIAREYGLPTVANVVGAMTRLHEGQRVKVDAGSGTIRLEEILDSHSVAKESRADCT
jgi:pyruvate,water dikinase